MSKHIRRERREKEQDFNPIENKIVKEFLDGKSIRELSKTYEQFGRTSIKNLLTDYANIFPEYSEKISQRLYKNKTHKENDNSEITEKHSDENDNEYLYLKFLNMSDEEKKKFIFEKLNSRRVKCEKNEYSEELLERKFTRFRKYFLEERNLKLNKPLTEKEIWNMLYDTPSLLASSLDNKIKPSMENLDEHADIGYEQATRIVSKNSVILVSSIDRTNLQIKLLKDYNLLKKFIEKPKYFRTSPEMIYALIKFHIEKGDDTETIFITKSRLENKYGLSEDDLKKKYLIKEDKKYENSKYFDE